ncbi:MAG: hypothetical protein JAZ17_27745 [Candidatus Thiodiazotropha endolucinida]|nr:hypothetical protein [Candidatus Thiodiazotropha taylori]MCG8097366.1 hypothetical protein [Candidatus Thiodiazotropha endolucinida]MCG7890144.1 hypothetical protein [Candidatus Thiodiazotropha taylori]MCG7953566.1 hypothetical protein [Candidatus Thiodiazotropha taylori]MCW4263836.1 hypothetical protein [Candidatus Thiodiazotropha endolucinida]
MKLRTFLKYATKRERADLATVCNGSIAYLYQLAGQHRHASPQMATRIEQVSKLVAYQSRGRLEPVPRESLVRHPEIFVGLQGLE